MYVYEIRGYKEKKSIFYNLAMNEYERGMIVQSLMKDPRFDKIRVTEMEQNSAFTVSVTRYDLSGGAWKMRCKTIGEDKI